MSITVELSFDARRMLDEADDLWISEHGYDHENPLLIEVARAPELLRGSPELGTRYRDVRRDVRRVLLRSGWHLYDAFDRASSKVVILAVWFASRGEAPPL